MPSIRQGTSTQAFSGRLVISPVFQHVAVDSVCGIVDIRVYDRHAEFVANLVFHGMRGNFFAQLLPARDLVDTAPRIFVEGNFETLYQFGITGFDVIRVVLRGVLARFRVIVTETVHDVVPHEIPRHFLGIFAAQRTSFDLGIQVFARLIFDLQKPRLVVDARDLPFTVAYIFVHAERFEQAFRAYLHAVAKADGAQIEISQHIPREHAHRVRIIQKERVRTDFMDIFRKVFQHGNRSQRAENAGRYRAYRQSSALNRTFSALRSP